MALINAITSVSVSSGSMIKSSSVLSDDIIDKLKELNIDVSKVSSETEAKRLIDEAEEEQTEAASEQTDAEILYDDIKSLGRQLGLEFTQNENIQDIFDEISLTLDEFEENSYNSNFNIIRSELDILKREFKFLYSGDSSMLSAMDILSNNNRAVLGI